MSRFVQPSRVVSLFLLVMSLVYQSCEYQPSGIYVNDTDQDVIPPEIEAVDLNIYSDTLYVYTKKAVQFTFQSTDQKINYCQVLLNGDEKETIFSNTGEFLLDPVRLWKGTHELKINIFTKSGTGSIASHVSAEGYMFSFSWTVIVDHGFVNHMKHEINNGMLNILWVPYQEKDFKKYHLYRHKRNDGDILLDSTESIHFIDSSYVGEGATYSLKVIKTNGQKIHWGEFSIGSDIPKLRFTSNINNRHIVFWNQCQFYSAIEKIEVIDDRTNEVLKSTDNMNDTIISFKDSYVFGKQLSLKLKVIPKHKNTFYYSDQRGIYDDYRRITLGYPIYPRFYHFNPGVKRIGPDKFIYTSDGESLSLYTLPELKTIDNFEFTTPDACRIAYTPDYIVSPDGRYIALTIYNCDIVKLRRTNDIQNYTLHDLSHLEGFDSQNRIAISDNATGILKGGQNSIYIYDFTNDTVLTKFSRGWDIRNYKISPEGNYFFLTASQLKIYKYTQDTVITTWDNPLDLKYKFYKFDAATPKQYVLWDGDKFVVRRCSDNSTVYSFNLSHDKLLNIDYYNNKILTMNGRRLFVLDYHSGEVEETIPVSSTDKNYKIIDSHIIREDGFIHFLNSN